MTTNSVRSSATIYQFPAGGRRALGQHRDEATIAHDVTPPRVSGEAIGGAWYHEAAIQEAKFAGSC